MVGRQRSWDTGILNDSKSDYTEGRFIRFRVELTDVSTTGTWVAPVCRDYNKDRGTFGYTQIQPFDTSRTPTLDPPGAILEPDNGTAFDGIGIDILDVEYFTSSSGVYDGVTYTLGDSATHDCQVHRKYRRYQVPPLGRLLGEARRH